MQRASRKTDHAIADIVASLEAGDDLRRTMVRINARIVDYQSAGEEVPPSLLRLSKSVATECAAQSQGR
jgi:hypothetical protein